VPGSSVQYRTKGETTMSDTKPVPVALDEYTREDGYLCELTKHGASSFDVDMWKPDGNNHWNKWFNNETKARAEFERWRK